MEIYRTDSFLNHCTDERKTLGGRRLGSPQSSATLPLALSPCTATALHYSRFFMSFCSPLPSRGGFLLARSGLALSQGPSSLRYLKKPRDSSARAQRSPVSQLPALSPPSPPSPAARRPGPAAGCGVNLGGAAGHRLLPRRPGILWPAR